MKGLLRYSLVQLRRGAHGGSRRFEMKNSTPEDAIVRLNAARFGSLVTSDGKALGREHLPYLMQLRTAALNWIDAIDIEIQHCEELEPTASAESQVA
jgi:hypothetical protein